MSFLSNLFPSACPVTDPAPEAVVAPDVTTAADPVASPSADIFGLPEALAAAAPHADPAVWVPALTDAMNKVGATSPKCVSAWLGQSSVEAGSGFQELSENTNYTSPARLLAIFPREFNSATAAAAAGHPEIIANTAYANRLGNGNVASGDGYRYRGKGLVQVTGKTEYEKFAAWAGMSVEDAADYAITPAGAAMTMAWYWEANGLGALAENWQLTEITRRINGAACEGLQQRIAASNAALATYGASA